MGAPVVGAGVVAWFPDAGAGGARDSKVRTGVHVRDVADSLGMRWRFVTALLLLGVIVAAVASMLVTPAYTATATTFVSASRGAPSDVATAVADALLVRERVTSYVDLVTTTDAMETVRTQTGVDLSTAELADAVSVENPPGSALLEISATDPNPEDAQSIANAAAEQLQSSVDQLERPTDGGEAMVEVSIIEPAVLPDTPSSPRTVLNLVLGGLVGLVTGVAVALLRPVRLTSAGQLRRYVDRPVLGVVPRERDDPAARAEALRQVQDNLRFVEIDQRPLAVVITDTVAGSGATSLAVNLSQTLAYSGEPVILVDGDLASSTLTEALNLPPGAGLTDVLAGEAEVDDALRPWGSVDNLRVMSAGATPPNPSDLLDSKTMADLIEELRQRATVIIDAPPVLTGRGAAALARATAGAIVVVRNRSTTRDQLRGAVNRVEGGGGRVLGLVFADAVDARAVAARPSEPAPRSAFAPHPGLHVGGVGLAGVPRTIELPPGPESAASPVLEAAVPADAKVIGGAAGVPLVVPSGQPLPQVVDLRALELERAGVRLGLDDDSRLADVDEVPVGGAVVSDDGWQPPPPRAAFDPLTAPYDQLARYLAELDEPDGPRPTA